MNESSPMSSVFWHNPATFEFTPLFIELIQECNVFLDVGANLGFYSFLAEKCQPNITIHAFEPSNGAFYFLDKNKQHNKGKNTFVHKIALSDFAFILLAHPIDDCRVCLQQHSHFKAIDDA